MFCLKHDWEVVRSERETSIMSRIYNRNIPNHIFYEEGIYQVKVCLKCGKIKDEIKAREEAELRTIQETQSRKAKAKKLYEKVKK